jgi:hypothetical protein
MKSDFLGQKLAQTLVTEKKNTLQQQAPSTLERP